MTTQDNRFLWLALAAVPGVGAVTYKALITAFQDPEKVFAAGESELKAAGIAAQAIKGLQGFTPPSSIGDTLKKADDLGIEVIPLGYPAYPARLREIPGPPPYLYVRGNLPEADSPTISFVGSRQATWYGRDTTTRLCRELAGRGVTIISGMARGIDTCAHKGALDGGGRTIAVLGCGLDICYPPENAGLAETIASSGALVSEFALGTGPNPENFPRRNRIISGLALGTVVVEAAPDSGSLITAQLALDQGRKVFAVPGNLNSAQSRGTNTLIKAGATLVTGAEDIIEALLPHFRGMSARVAASKTNAPLPPMSADEDRMYRTLTLEPKHIDLISTETGAPVHLVSAILMGLELKGLLRQLPGKMFVAS